MLIDKPTPAIAAQVPFSCDGFAAKRKRLEAQPLLVLAPGHKQVSSDKVARPRLSIGGAKPVTVSQTTDSYRSQSRTVHVPGHDLVPSTSDKGCNSDGMPDMHASRHTSVHPDAAPSVFKAFVKHTQNDYSEHGLHQPKPDRKVFNGGVHEFFNQLDNSHSDGVTSYWGTFLTTRGVKRECDAAFSRSSICAHPHHSVQEHSFLTKRRKLYSSPASLRVYSNQLAVTSDFASPSQRDSTVGTNAPT